MRPRSPQPILAIDLLRFACALLVLAFHLTTMFPLSSAAAVRSFDAGASLPSDLASFSWFGWVGVELFFVISGYVIALSAGDASRGAFVRRRVLRLAPAAWIAASIAAVLLLLGTDEPARQIVPRWIDALLFVPVPQPIDASYWTLSVEVIFYALVTCVLRGVGNARRIERVGVALGLASALFWAAVAMGAIPRDAVFGAFGLTLTLLPHGIFFALGIVLHSLRNRRATLRRVLPVVAFAAVAVLEVVLHAQTMRDVPGIRADPAQPATVFLAGIATLALADRMQHGLARTLGVARLVTLGRMTYPLYLLHQTVAAAAVALLLAVGVSGGLALAGAAVTVLAGAWIVSERAEPPLRAWLAASIAARFKPRHAPAPDMLPTAFPPAG